MSKERRNRSSNGCLTCRKRRKKCDELAYPTCQNCDKKGLDCTWSEKTIELHKSMNNVKYFGDDDKKHKKRGKIKESGDVADVSITDREPSLLSESSYTESETKNISPLTNTEAHTELHTKVRTIHTKGDSTEDLRLPDLIKDIPNYKTDKYDFDFGTVEEVNLNDYIDFHDKKSFLERIALQQDIVDE